MKVNFAVSFDDEGVLDHLTKQAMASASGVAHDCDGAIQVRILSVIPISDDNGE